MKYINVVALQNNKNNVKDKSIEVKEYRDIEIKAVNMNL